MSFAAGAQTRLAEAQIDSSIGSRVLNGKEDLLSGRPAREIRALLEERCVLVFPEIHFTDAEQVAFTAEYLKGSLYWHLDGTMNDTPILASLLSCKRLASWGGNTGFCNTYAAWESLPEKLKAELDGLRVVHSAWATMFYYEPEPSLANLKDMQAIGERELPLVWNLREHARTVGRNGVTAIASRVRDKDLRAATRRNAQHHTTKAPIHGCEV